MALAYLATIAAIIIGAFMGYLTRSKLIPCSSCGGAVSSSGASFFAPPPPLDPVAEKTKYEALQYKAKRLRVERSIADDEAAIKATKKDDFDLFGLGNFGK